MLLTDSFEIIFSRAAGRLIYRCENTSKRICHLDCEADLRSSSIAEDRHVRAVLRRGRPCIARRKAGI
jgi:hypothetical protein